MLIVADQNIARVGEAFSAFGEVRLLPGREIDSAALEDADLLLVRSVTRVDEQLLKGSSVRMVATATAGLDHVDHAYLKRAGIAFAYAPGSNATPVVEYVIAALLLHAEKLGQPVHGLSVGIVGCGNVGSRLAAMLEAIGIRCFVNDPPLAHRTSAEDFVSFDHVLKADVVSLHVPLIGNGDHATRRMVGLTELTRLKSGALLINTSRGEVIDEMDLLRFAYERPDVRLALDVWAGEPRISADLLRRAWLATPHIAGYSVDAKLRGTWHIYRACARFFSVETHWDYEQYLEPANDPVELASADEDTNLRAAVLSVYDPRLDDNNLRGTLKLREPERAAAFDDLRKNYRQRREFDSRTVSAPLAGTALRLKLKSLGFRLSG
jgi:erythronate-4-phosphate dehydrogenase